MRAFQVVFFTTLSMSLLTSCATQKQTGLTALEIPASQRRGIANTDQVPFVKHEEKGAFKSYLAMNLPYPEFEKIRESLETKEHLKLINRGEAHITVVTPPEYDKVLSKKVSIREIHALAEKMNIQDSPYQKVCVGKGSSKIDGAEQKTYFVVIHSDRLFEIRKAIQELYVSRGGKAQDFNAESFFPHVTLGYTKRDLHFEDGVTKDASSCILTLQEGEHAKKK
ncbi:2'-5' RNA ligase family protein [Bdellovibrio svalbardensis]|uniref:2'-5' RNA ligase family protein n=1 Tax=Bdellovibrio svalbardensis TaxID=2972972 RepID=A0ABT6DIB8_9BACT|nr:2'-5' RNA ligase family protein [Bdellovibrio svalbardensis]MDG0816567.1 2'-5' RNA ligase family protein [Bdellovibrio svalbardensis]